MNTARRTMMCCCTEARGISLARDCAAFDLVSL